MTLKSTATLLTLLGLLACYGCQPAETNKADAPADSSAELGEDHGDHAEPPALSEEDQKLADAQKFCPVGGELGSMGTPVKVMVDDKPVFLCCEHCRKPLLDDPEKYMAELAKKQAKDAAKSDGEPAAEPGGLAAPGPADDAS